jgi:hypothetical protein
MYTVSTKVYRNPVSVLEMKWEYDEDSFLLEYDAHYWVIGS